MAIKVIIVDDNRSTVRSLALGVEWEELGLAVAGTAYDGEEGAELIRRVKPDIIITDISMPCMDGLTMVETALDAVPDSKVIVITGYDKFQYASRAIKLSVFDYILKPIDDEELLTALKRAVKSIEKDRDAGRQEDILLRGRLLSALMGEKGKCVSDLGLSPEGNFSHCAVMIAETDEGFSQPFLQRLDFSGLFGQKKTVTALFEEKLVLLAAGGEQGWEEDVREAQDFLRENDSGIRIGASQIHGIHSPVKELYLEAYENMLHAMEKSREAAGGRRESAGRVADLQEEAVRLAEQANGLKDYEDTLNTFARCTGGSMISLQIMAVIYCTKVMERFKQWEDVLEPVIYSAVNITSPEMFGLWLKSFLKTLDAVRENGKGASGLVTDALSYMKSHALENVKLEQVAEQFFVSPNYLSALIRKETGVTFQQHMLQNKMMISKQLLDDTRMRVEEIAYAVGYENYVSFYNAFKKIEGISPREYRMRNR